MSLLAAQVDANSGDPLYQTENLAQVYTDPDPRTYELSYYSYLVVPTDLTHNMTDDKGYTLGAFGQYLLCAGQQQVDGLGYAALPINLVEDGFAQLATIPGADVPTTTAATLQGCDNPTFTPDGIDTLNLTDPQPPACDQQGASPCVARRHRGVATTLMAASPSPATAGQPVTLIAGVAPASGTTTPTGTVQFMIGDTAIGDPATVGSNGVTTVTTTSTRPEPTRCRRSTRRPTPPPSARPPARSSSP